MNIEEKLNKYRYIKESASLDFRNCSSVDSFWLREWAALILLMDMPFLETDAFKKKKFIIYEWW